MPEFRPSTRAERRLGAGVPTVGALTCVGYLNALGLSGLCDPADDAPLSREPPGDTRGTRPSRSEPR